MFIAVDMRANTDLDIETDITSIAWIYTFDSDDLIRNFHTERVYCVLYCYNELSFLLNIRNKYTITTLNLTNGI